MWNLTVPRSSSRAAAYLACALMGVLLGLLQACHEPPPPPKPAAKAPRVEISSSAEQQRWGHSAGLRYLESVRGGASMDERLPMVVILHGLGDHAHTHWLEGVTLRARFVMPEAPIAYHRGYAWFPYRVRDTTDAELATHLKPAADGVAAFLTQVAKERPTVGKPLVAGFSQGGMLSYALALTHPDTLSAAHPISGALPEALWPATRDVSVTYPPIFAVHGELDAIVPLAPTQRAVDALKLRGFDIELQTFPGVGHTQSTSMHDAMLRWLRERLPTSP